MEGAYSVPPGDDVAGEFSLDVLGVELLCFLEFALLLVGFPLFFEFLLLEGLLLDFLLVLAVVDVGSLDAFHAPGQSEIADFDGAVFVEEDVG